MIVGGSCGAASSSRKKSKSNRGVKYLKNKILTPLINKATGVLLNIKNHRGLRTTRERVRSVHVICWYHSLKVADGYLKREYPKNGRD